MSSVILGRYSLGGERAQCGIESGSIVTGREIKVSQLGKQVDHNKSLRIEGRLFQRYGKKMDGYERKFTALQMDIENDIERLQKPFMKLSTLVGGFIQVNTFVRGIFQPRTSGKVLDFNSTSFSREKNRRIRKLCKRILKIRTRIQTNNEKAERVKRKIESRSINYSPVRNFNIQKKLPYILYADLTENKGSLESMRLTHKRDVLKALKGLGDSPSSQKLSFLTQYYLAKIAKTAPFTASKGEKSVMRVLRDSQQKVFMTYEKGKIAIQSSRLVRGASATQCWVESIDIEKTDDESACRVIIGRDVMDLTKEEQL